MLLIKRNALGKKLSPNDTIVMEKSSQKRLWNDFPLNNPGTMLLNSKTMLLHQLIAEFTHCHPKKRKNNMNFSLKTYAYKEFAALNHPMQVDSSSSERKMANFVQFKTIKT